MNEYPIIGMSPGNSYFKEDKIKFVLERVLKEYGETAIMIADIPAISTYIAMGYPANRARTDKAVRDSNNFKNRTERVMDDSNISEDKVKIIDWADEVEYNPDYRKKYHEVRSLYENNQEFRRACHQKTQSVLEYSRKEIEDMDKAVKIGVHYLLSEFAFLEHAPDFFDKDKIVYVYHNNWPVYENYIAGSFDGKDRRNYLDFQLIEHPTEAFIPLVGNEELDMKDDETALERIQRTGFIYAAYTEYDPAFIVGEHEKSGIFHDVLTQIADKKNFEIMWTQEVGYGAIVDGLKDKQFDVFASTVWPTEERKENAIFSKPLYYSNVYPWVSNKKNFEGKLEEVDELRIAVKKDDISDSIAGDFPDADKVYLEQLADIPELLKAVVEGRADVTFVEPYVAKNFNKNNDSKVMQASDNPIRTYKNSFIFRENEEDLKKFFDEQIQDLKESGAISELIEEYTGSGNTFGTDIN